jgi:TRAP-type mannitol/chloroaromatic compound transport system substrate-binding protein
MTANEMAGWLQFGGGQELWDEVSAKFNVKPFMCTSTGPQMGGWFNRRIRTLDDFKGLKIRMPGLGGEALRRLGATPVNLPGGEIYAALEQGSLDAAEWVGPWNDLAAGLHKVARHYYYPAFQEPAGVLALGINRDVWESFTPLQQTIVREVTTAEYTRSLSEFNVQNARALATLRNEHGIEPEGFSPEILTILGKLSGEIVAEVGRADDLTARVCESFMEARRQAMAWAAVGEEAITSARRLDFPY